MGNTFDGIEPGSLVELNFNRITIHEKQFKCIDLCSPTATAATPAFRPWMGGWSRWHPSDTKGQTPYTFLCPVIFRGKFDDVYEPLREFDLAYPWERILGDVIIVAWTFRSDLLMFGFIGQEEHFVSTRIVR